MPKPAAMLSRWVSQIVSIAPVSRLHISCWYMILDVYTDSARGICDKMFNNTNVASPALTKNGNVF